MSSLDEAGLLKEMEACKDSIQSVCGVEPTLFRPPEGATTKTVLKCSERFSYPIILWSVDTKDWEVKNAGKIAVSGSDLPGVLLYERNCALPDALGRRSR